MTKTSTLLKRDRLIGKSLDRLAVKDPNWTEEEKRTIWALIRERQAIRMELQQRNALPRWQDNVRP